MGGKHLKKLRAEKSKIHLKKKKLPKGQNITDTAFKVKKILTIEQLKTVNKDEPVSNWNVPINDLLVRLNHYNFTSRLNSLTGIKEVLTNYPEILQGPSLNPLVSRLLGLLTDEERKIRKTAIGLLSYLFNLIPMSAIFPFNDILYLHLKCAMTHRNLNVQWDSLKFIDVMIKYSPEALRRNFKSIAQNFIRILKNFLSEYFGGMQLKENLEKSKTEMLLRFYKFMDVGYLNATPTSQSSCKTIDLDTSNSEKIFLRELNDQYKQMPDLSLLFMNSKCKDTNLGQKDVEEFQFLCSLAMPFIFETWIEVCPSERPKRHSECMLTEGAAELLKVLLKIVMFLYERAVALGSQMDCWFISLYSQSFEKCFTSNFPYVPSATIKKLTSNKPSEFARPGFNSYVMQNLIICYMSYSLKITLDKDNLATVMENYISWALTRKNSPDCQILSKVIQAMLKASNPKIGNVILKVVIKAYDATENPELRKALLKTLVKIVLDENESVKEKCIVDWMKSLPEHFYKTPVSIQVIETVLQLVKRPAGAEILTQLEEKAIEIMHNLPNLEVEGVGKFEGQKMMVDILYWCNNKVLEEVLEKEVLSNESCSQKLRNYVKDIFRHKLQVSVTN